MKAVSDSTPLIYLSKIGCLHLLKHLFEEIIIPKEVYNEVIAKGKEKKKNEVLFIEEMIEDKFILIKEPKSSLNIENLDKGEKECIALCKELGIKVILIDEKTGSNISYMLNLNPIRTTLILVASLDKKLINLARYKELLKTLPQEGYFIDSLTHQKLISIGENIARKQ